MGNSEATIERMNMKEQDNLKDKANNPKVEKDKALNPKEGQLNKLDAAVKSIVKDQEKVQEKAYNPEEKLDAALEKKVM